jgi:nicotinate-nucleotide--dimethylbenzimidazole phosphoribosyltransferase
MSWRTLLVLGGLGSGTLAFAESLLAPVSPRRITPPANADLDGLARILADTEPGDLLLVDDLTAWLPSATRSSAADPAESGTALVTAVTDGAGRVVLLSAEVGLGTTPTTAANRRLAETLGELNLALAEAVDAVVLVVAGQPCWLKGGPAAAGGTVGGAAARGPVAAAPLGAVASAAAVPAGAAAAAEQPVLGLSNLAQLPAPDQDARSAAEERLANLGALGFGQLGQVVRFAAATQGLPSPAPWRRPRLLVLYGRHEGGASAGPTSGPDRAAALREGSDPLAMLAGTAGAGVQLVETTAAAAFEEQPAMPEERVESALARGWQLAEQAADEGIDVLVLGSIGDGAEAAAAAVTAVLAPSTEPAVLLGRVRTAQGLIDDEAWMLRCAAVRDAVHRVRQVGRITGRPLLAELGGEDLAVATGLLLGAAARRTPVLLDGPVGAASGLVARNLAAAARHWWLLPDAGGHPLVTRVRDTLGLTPVLDLRLELGEGAGALAALPLLQSALSMARHLSGAD